MDDEEEAEQNVMECLGSPRPTRHLVRLVHARLHRRDKRHLSGASRLRPKTCGN